MEKLMTEENEEMAEVILPEEEDGEQVTDDMEVEAGQEPEEQNEDAPKTEQAGEERAEAESPDEEIETTVESVIEAVLFASDESLTAARLCSIVGTGTKQVCEKIELLNEKYKAGSHAFRIEKIAGGYQMLTLGPYNHWLRKLLRSRSDTKLSPAALETLAIIAYKQPIIRADIEAIRGVAAGEMIRNLMYKGLAKIVGRAEVLGRPMLYGTTKKFLEVFGLNTLKDLPKIEELKKPGC